MLMINTDKLIAILKQEVTPAMGCTEPAAVALDAINTRKKSEQIAKRGYWIAPIF
ncbi:MAG: hypothetical protein FJ042_02860 [Candidatus Cloacimonetes bacterium]|nr:hypothetical protein [Candidatus Cloacimonadota bacterium]